MGGTGTDMTKSASGHVRQMCAFASGGICGSCSAFWCIRGVKHRRTLFHAHSGLGAVFIKSTSGQVTPNLCFHIRWALWVTYCIPVHPGHEMSTHYFSCLGGTGTKSTPGHMMPNLCFLHPVGSTGHIVYSNVSGA
jgi:hypothetical protein